MREGGCGHPAVRGGDEGAAEDVWGEGCGEVFARLSEEGGVCGHGWGAEVHGSVGKASTAIAAWARTQIHSLERAASIPALLSI